MAVRPAWCRREDRKGRRPRLVPWPRTPFRPKRAKRRRWAPLRPRPRRPIHEVQGWGIFDRYNGEFSTGIDTTSLLARGREVDNQVAAPTESSTPNLHRATIAQQRVRMEGWRQRRLG